MRRSEEEIFWSRQYEDHCDFIISGICDPHIQNRAKEFKQLWQAEVWNDELLQEFYEFKMMLYTVVLNKEIESWLTPMVFEDMVTEIQWMLKRDERTKENTLLFWLNNIEGHLAITESWIDPAHEELRERSLELASSYTELKMELGLGKNRNLSNLQNRQETGEELKDNIQGNFNTVLAKLKILQQGVTKFYRLIQDLLLEKEIFGVLTPLFVEHTIRECERAELDLSLL